MPQMLDVLRIVFGERRLSHGEYAKTLASSCQREEAQRMKQAWQDHIEAAAAVFEDSRSVSDSSSEGCFLESLVEHLDGVFLIAIQLWKNRAFVACINKVLRMEHHVFNVYHRPSSCFFVGSESMEPPEFLLSARRCLRSRKLGSVLDDPTFNKHPQQKKRYRYPMK